MYLENLARRWENPEIPLSCTPAVALDNFFFYSLSSLFCNKECICCVEQSSSMLFLSSDKCCDPGSAVATWTHDNYGIVTDGDLFSTLFWLLEKIQQTVQLSVSLPSLKEDESLDLFSCEPYLYCVCSQNACKPEFA